MNDPQSEFRTFSPYFDIEPPLLADDALDETVSWDGICSSALIHKVRWHTGLSQGEFAEVYRIDLDHLRALERGAVQPDRALVAYLTVIDRAPTLVRSALQAS